MDKIRPKTIKESVNVLISRMNTREKIYFGNRSKEDLINLHHSLGRFIRNIFGLWYNNNALLKDCNKKHPDDASMVIIEHLWDKLNEGKNEKGNPK
jgi:hypothetical protein